MFKIVPTNKDNNSLAKKTTSFEDIFDSFFNEFVEPMTDRFTFLVDVKEDETSYTIEADLPGYSKDDVTIRYEGGYLNIEAVKEQEEKKETCQFIRRERRRGKVSRRFFIENIDGKTISATFKDGILTIKMDKKSDPERGRIIEIK